MPDCFLHITRSLQNKSVWHIQNYSGMLVEWAKKRMKKVKEENEEGQGREANSRMMARHDGYLESAGSSNLQKRYSVVVLERLRCRFLGDRVELNNRRQFIVPGVPS